MRNNMYQVCECDESVEWDDQEGRDRDGLGAQATLDTFSGAVINKVENNQVSEGSLLKHRISGFNGFYSPDVLLEGNYR